MLNKLAFVLSIILIVVGILFFSNYSLFNSEKQNIGNIAKQISSSNTQEKNPNKLNSNLKKPEIENDLPKQLFEDLTWKDYVNKDFSMNFSYPDNLNSYCFAQSGSSLVTVSNKENLIYKMSICEDMGYIVDITIREKWEGTIQDWISQSDLLHGVGKETLFNGYPAIYYEIDETQQIPTDVYILKNKGFIVTIGVMRVEKDEDFNKDVINKIINSVKFN